MNLRGHFFIYFYLIFFLLNIKIINFTNFSFNNHIIDQVFSEILLFDFVILIYSIFLIKEFLITIKKIIKNIYFKLFFSIFIIGILGIFFSYFFDVGKTSNIIFITLFYLNLIKIFISLVILNILSEKHNFKITNLFIFSMIIFMLIIIFYNIFNQGFYSRLYYPFLNRTTGYNLLGYLTGILFFISFNHNENNLKKENYFLGLINSIILFLILFLTFSKTSIISFIIVFIFYFIFLKRDLKKTYLYFFLIIILSITLILDIIKYNYFGNVFSFLDIFLNPLSWFKEYNSFYYRIEHVWLGSFHKDLNLITFLFGEGRFSPKTHDSLYFTILSRFGFLGLGIFLYLIYVLFKNSNLKTHSVLSFILITGLTSEMILQSNIINPLAIMLVYLNFQQN